MGSWFDQIESSDSTSSETPTEVKEPINIPRWLIISCLALIIVIVLGGGFLFTSLTAANSNEVMPQAKSQQVAVAGQCNPKEGEIRLPSTDTTLRGTIVKWQKAYYERDLGLTQYLTPDSWLQGQDWKEILSKGAPQGSEWCVVMSPVKANQVDVDLMVTFPDSSSQTYYQTVEGTQTQPGHWLITDISPR